MGDIYRATESFYGGGGSNFNPNQSNSFVHSQLDTPPAGYRLHPQQIGFSTNPMTADQLSELQRGIRSGAKVIEVNLLKIQGDTDQQVPKQHFEEMKALSKLTGISPSLHGPLVDAAGFDERSAQWSEENRENNERVMLAAMEKAHWADPNKNIPVIFHSSNLLGSGTQYKPEKVEGQDIHNFKEEIVPIISKEDRRLIPVTERTLYEFGAAGTKEDPVEKKYSPDEFILQNSKKSWGDAINDLATEKARADELLDERIGNALGLETMRGEDPFKEMPDGERQKERFNTGVKMAGTILHHNRESFKSLFQTAYKYGTKEQKEELDKMSREWKGESQTIQQQAQTPIEKMKADSVLQDKYFERLKGITGLGGEESPYKGEAFGAPNMYERGETFAMKQAAKTFGRVAGQAYQQFGRDGSPMVAIENVWNGAMFSRGKDMKELVETSRKEMVNYLVKEEKMNEKKAQKIAEEKIGMNFDVGHMNMFRKKGFTAEDMAAEVKEFAPLVKHMHLTDNFGFSDEHLYPGQGNVPFKEFFKELKKAQPNIDKDVKMIVETGGVEQRSMGGRSAHAFNLAAFGVPIFGGDFWAGPTFDASINMFGSYSSGYGEVNPQNHHSMYGAGFTDLPSEVGGIMPGGGRSRFGGTPLA